MWGTGDAAQVAIPFATSCFPYACYGAITGVTFQNKCFKKHTQFLRCDACSFTPNTCSTTKLSTH